MTILVELARYADVPVINGLTKRSHPCQVMADVLTFEEHRGPIKGRKVAWSGDSQQCAGELGSRRPALRFLARRGDAGGVGAAPRPH